MFQAIQEQAPQILSAVLLMMVWSLLLKPVARKISLVDKPSARKTHQNIIPLIGGICVFLTGGVLLLIFGDMWAKYTEPMVISASLFLFLGVLDDKFDLKARIKLLTQVSVSLIFLLSVGLQISTLGNPFGFGHTFELGFLSLPFTILAIVGLTNAFNMIDGCDGLAASLAAFVILALLYFGLSRFEFLTQNFLLTLVVSVFVFLFFNFSNNPAQKVFLGDGGSLFLGFIVSVLLVEFAEGNNTYSPSVVLWFVAIPVFDFCAVVMRRVLLKRKIMTADRSHLHHYLLSFGLSHLQVTMFVLATATTLLCIGIFFETNYPSLSLLAFVGLFIVYFSVRMFKHRD